MKPTCRMKVTSRQPMMPGADCKTVRPVMTASAALTQWRLELFFKTEEELKAQLPFLRKHDISRLNLTNKSNTDDLLASVRILQESLPGLDVCVHYSIKYNYVKTPVATFGRLQTFCTQLQQHTSTSDGTAGLAAAAAAGATSVTATGDIRNTAAIPKLASCHVLLVSGGGKEKSFDTTSALQQIQAQLTPQQPVHSQQIQAEITVKQQQQDAVSKDSKKRPRYEPSYNLDHQQQLTKLEAEASWPSFAVAFNPYLPDEQEAALERERLRTKLATGLVDKVYLQMGTDLERLHAGLNHANSLFDELYTSLGELRPQLLGSVFIPSKRLLAQMKFRPWNGVFLSSEYLSSVPNADKITRQILQVYAEAGVVPLVESPIKNDEELARALDLLSLVYA